MKFTRRTMAITKSAIDAEWNFSQGPQTKPDIRDGVATIVVRGPMSHHRDGEFEFYDGILTRCSAAFIDPRVKRVVIRGNTPGGEVSGCFSGARDLRRMADRYGKPLDWFVDGQTCSAGVAWAVACDRIILPKEAQFGSIGVIATLQSVARAEEAMGIDTRLVTSGARKGDGHPSVAFDDDVIEAIQASVDYEAQCFFEWISERRGIPVETIRDWEAKIFHGQQAVDIGLADVVGDSPLTVGPSVSNRSKSKSMAVDDTYVPPADNGPVVPPADEDDCELEGDEAELDDDEELDDEPMKESDMLNPYAGMNTEQLAREIMKEQKLCKEAMKRGKAEMRAENARLAQAQRAQKRRVSNDQRPIRPNPQLCAAFRSRALNSNKSAADLARAAGYNAKAIGLVGMLDTVPGDMIRAAHMQQSLQPIPCDSSGEIECGLISPEAAKAWLELNGVRHA